MNTYQNLGQAIFDIVNAVNLTGLTSSGAWGSAFNYEAKELLVYPAFTVRPSEDSETWLDSTLNEDQVSFVLTIFVRYEDASAAEDQARKIVDKVRDAIRKNLSLNNSVDFQVETKGRWLFSDDRGLRIYEQTLTAKKAESIL